MGLPAIQVKIFDGVVAMSLKLQSIDMKSCYETLNWASFLPTVSLLL